MIKRILSVFTALALCFSMLACKISTDGSGGKKSDDENNGGTAASAGDFLGFFSDMRNAKATVSISDLTKLEKYQDIVGDAFPEPIDIKDFIGEFYFDMDGGKLAQIGIAKLDGAKHEFAMYEGKDYIVFDSALIDKMSGIYEEDLGDDYEEMFPQIATFVNTSVTGEFINKYAKELCDAFVAEADADDETDKDGNRVVTFEADTEQLIEIGKLLEKTLKKDGYSKEFEPPVIGKIMDIYKYGEDSIKNAGYIQDVYNYEGEIIIDPNGNVIEADVIIDYTYNNRKNPEYEYSYVEDITYEYDATTKEFDYSYDTEYNNGEIDEYTLYGIVGEKYIINSCSEWVGSIYDDEWNKVGEAPCTSDGVFSLEFKDGVALLAIDMDETYSKYENGRIVETSDNTEASLSVKYSISGNTLTLVPMDLEYLDMEFKGIGENLGIKIVIDKNTDMFEFPKDFVEYDEDEWEDFNDEVFYPICDEYEYILTFLSKLGESIYLK